MGSQGFLGNRELVWWGIRKAPGFTATFASSSWQRCWVQQILEVLIFLMVGEEFRHQVLPNPSSLLGGRCGEEGESKPPKQREIWGYFPQISLLQTRQEVLNSNSSLNQGWLWGINLSILFPLPLLTTTKRIYKYLFSTLCILQIEGTAFPGAWNIPRGLWHGMKGTKGGKSSLSKLLFCAANVDVTTSSARRRHSDKRISSFLGTVLQCVSNLNFKCCLFFF